MDWDKKISGLLEILHQNNISALYLENQTQAFEKVMSMIPPGSVVGFGDSVTLRQIGIIDALEKGPYPFLNPWQAGITVEENIKRKKRALTSDIFIRFRALRLTSRTQATILFSPSRLRHLWS